MDEREARMPNSVGVPMSEKLVRQPLRNKLIKHKMRLIEQISRLDKAIIFLDHHGEAAEQFLDNIRG